MEEAERMLRELALTDNVHIMSRRQVRDDGTVSLSIFSYEYSGSGHMVFRNWFLNERLVFESQSLSVRASTSEGRFRITHKYDLAGNHTETRVKKLGTPIEPMPEPSAAMLEEARQRKLSVVENRISPDSLPRTAEEARELLRSVAIDPERLHVSFQQSGSGDQARVNVSSREEIAEDHYINRQITISRERRTIEQYQIVLERREIDGYRVSYRHEYDLDGNYVSTKPFVRVKLKDESD